MNNQFDELTKNLAQSVTRRAALKKFGLGLAGLAFVAFGLANRATAATYHGYCEAAPVSGQLTGRCIAPNCLVGVSSRCKGYGGPSIQWSPCGGAWAAKKNCSF